jgi:pSer/pThr/pTyr-binding forkhead associated (FHA) protein
MQSWVIGSRAECDVVVNSPLASGRHCQLTHGPDGLTLVDLGSTQGTYVDGHRITAATRITPAQEITIGQTMPMPWPADLVKFVRIGRVEGNDIVLDDPRVSSRHARLMIVAGTSALIEDLGSSNGTFLNSVDARVTRLAPLSISDTVYFGSLGVPAARLLAGLLGAPAPPSLSKAARKEQPPLPAAVPASTGFITGNRALLGGLVQAPLLAFLIVVISGRQAAAAVTDANRVPVAQAIATTTFALAVAAVWLGCSLAVAELAAGAWRARSREATLESFFISLGSRLAVLVSTCALGCALLLAVVYWGAGLKGPWLPMWGVMMFASAVCLLVGLLISTVVQNWQSVALALLGCFALSTALGGWFWPLPRSGVPVSWAMNAMPTRWAFEGLLVLESSHHSTSATVDDPVPIPDRDLAEDYFPADSERMGPGADLTALGAMMIGMTFALTLASTRPP